MLKNVAKSRIREGSCTTLVLVEKLCTVCERRSTPSHTFRLPLAPQSATIPRCLIAAIRGPVILGRAARDDRG
jgi:hypothetical protein